MTQGFIASWSNRLRSSSPPSSSASSLLVTPLHFFFKRALRILPSYYFFLFIVLSITPLLPPGLLIASDRWLETLFLVQNFSPAVGKIFMSHTWTVAFELQFQLIFSFILSFILRRTSKPNRPSSQALLSPLLILFFSSILLKIIIILISLPSLDLPMPLFTFDFHLDSPLALVDSFQSRLYLFPFARLSSYFIGSIVAVVFDMKSKGKIEPTWASLSSIKLAALLLFFFWAVHTPIATTVAKRDPYSKLFLVLFLSTYRLGAGLLVGALLYWGLPHSALPPSPSRLLSLIETVLRWPVWFPIAELSYNAYLWHTFVFGGIFYGIRMLLPSLSATYLVVHSILFVSFFAVLVVAAIPHMVIEKKSWRANDYL